MAQVSFFHYKDLLHYNRQDHRHQSIVKNNDDNQHLEHHVYAVQDIREHHRFDPDEVVDNNHSHNHDNSNDHDNHHVHNQ